MNYHYHEYSKRAEYCRRLCGSKCYSSNGEVTVWRLPLRFLTNKCNKYEWIHDWPCFSNLQWFWPSADRCCYRDGGLSKMSRQLCVWTIHVKRKYRKHSNLLTSLANTWSTINGLFINSEPRPFSIDDASTARRTLSSFSHDTNRMKDLTRLHYKQIKHITRDMELNILQCMKTIEKQSLQYYTGIIKWRYSINKRITRHRTRSK